MQHAIDGTRVQAEAASVAQVAAIGDRHDKKLLFGIAGVVQCRVIDQ
jgi:hypothetical protein